MFIRSFDSLMENYERLLARPNPADEHFYCSTATYTGLTSKTTKNGYLSITMPDDATSGYYVINDGGMFRYYDCDKGEEESGDLVEAQDDTTVALSNSQQYIVSVPEKTTNITFNVAVDITESGSSNVKAVLTSPDGTQYDMTYNEETGIASVTMTEAAAGKWTVNVTPKTITVADVYVESSSSSSATAQTFEFTVEEGSNIKFYAIYKGSGDIWGTVVNEDGEVYSLEEDESYSDDTDSEDSEDEIEYENVDDSTYKLSYTYSYLPAGTYTVKIYHQSDTTITECNYENAEEYQTQDIITVEE